MIYLIQDCYKDENGKYHDVLKIGYSSKLFREGRKSQYDSHNYGYKLISEREGSQELEKYLHKRLVKYHLSLEWFKYDPEVIKIFNEVSEDDISQFNSQEELNEYIRYYILENLIPSVKELSSRHMKKLIKELKLIYVSSPEYYNSGIDFEEKLVEREIQRTFDFVMSSENNYIKDLDFRNPKIINILSENSLLIELSISKEDDSMKDKITSFYKTTRKENLPDKSEFDKLQDQRKQETEDLLEVYENGTKSQKLTLIKTFRDSIDKRNYSDNFVFISSKTGEPTYNKFIELANKRAWEVSQEDYQGIINITKALEEVSQEVSEYYDENEKIVKDFLDNNFYTTGIFEKKMKMYCEFMDKHQGNKEIENIIFFKIRDGKFRKYYNFYGTKGCSSRKYEEKYLYEGMMDSTKSGELQRAIYNYFKVGQRYTKKDIKSGLEKIFRDLNITSRKPKTSELGLYFNLTRTRITNPQTGKLDEGYKLEAL